MIRVGGSFIWPPPGINVTSIERLVFVAGGVGIKYINQRIIELLMLTRTLSTVL